MKLEKGCLIKVKGESWWFVFVHAYFNNDIKALFIHCICDNANNSYSFDVDEIEYVIGHEHESLLSSDSYICERIGMPKIPYDVMYEVLSGQHDDRW